MIDNIVGLKSLEIGDIASAPRLVLRFDKAVRESDGRGLRAGTKNRQSYRKECQRELSSSHSLQKVAAYGERVKSAVLIGV